MRKCQLHEIQVRLQDQLVHHELMVGETFLTSSLFMLLKVLATMTVLNKGPEVSKLSASNISTLISVLVYWLFGLYTSF